MINLLAEDSTFDKLAHDYGAFAAILIVIGPAVYKALTYLATKIVEPLAKKHIEFIDELAKANEVTKHTLNTIANTQEKIAANQGVQVSNETQLVDLAKTKLNMLSENRVQVAKIIDMVEDGVKKVDDINNRLGKNVT